MCNLSFLPFQASRRSVPVQPSISYKVIRRFISSKEFESPFGLQLLANTLNDIIYNGTPPQLPLHNHTGHPPCDSSDNISDDTVLYAAASPKTPPKTPQNDFHQHKKTFFSTDSDSQSSSSDSEEKNTANNSKNPEEEPDEKKEEEGDNKKEEDGDKKEDGEKNKENDDKKESDSDKELEKLLRMTEVNPGGGNKKSDSGEEEEKKEDEKVKKKKEEKEEVSLMDCLQGDDNMAESSTMMGDVGENEKDFLSAMNEEMKKVFLQTSDENSDSSNDEVEIPEKKEKKERCKTEKCDTKPRKDELSQFRFVEEKDDSTEKSSDGGAESDNSGTSVEYVEQVQKKSERKELTSESDSGSDIQQVYCKTSSPIKGRKNINKILKKENLQLETKQALKMETERKKRVNERMKQFQELFPDAENSSKLILDFDPDTKEELLVVDSALSSQLKSHQKEGVRFMWNCCFESLKKLEEDSGSGCVLAHCMGLGKTLQVITLVHTVLTQNTGVQTVMVMCPLNTLRNWCEEFKTWQKGCDKKVRPVDLIRWKSKHRRTAEVRRWFQHGGVLLVSYEMFRSLLKKGKYGSSFWKEFLEPGPDLVVCDEGHVLKNSKSALSKCILRMKTLRRIILTGTPLQNNLIEYYCMVQFVKPNILGTEKEFRNRFVNPITNGQFEDSTQLDVRLMKHRAHVLHTMLDGFIQRRGYYVLKPFLPEKQEYVISVALTNTQEEVYRMFLQHGMQEGRGLLKDFHRLQRVWTHPRTMLMQATQVRTDDGREEWEQLVPKSEYDSLTSSGKLLLLFDILKRCREIGDKVLVFSQSLYSLDLIEYFLHKANSYHSSGVNVDFADRWERGKDYFRLDGSTSSDNRDAYCQGFNSDQDERARLFLISTRAGGLGINLVAANRVIVFDASWNPTHDVQSIFRVYRFGQKKPCFIYRFLAAATMEEKIYKRQVTKLSLAYRILDEHQIERHYKMGNLQDLYRYDPKPKHEWKIPKIPKDDLFAGILSAHRDIIVGYHEHDSLLENKEEEELTEEERRAAWEDYEKEKLTPEYPRLLNGTTQLPTGNWPSRELISAMYRTMPRAQNAIINQSESDLCRIVEVRTLSGGRDNGESSGPCRNDGVSCWGNRGGVDMARNVEMSVPGRYQRVYPWNNPGGIIRGGTNEMNGVNEL